MTGHFGHSWPCSGQMRRTAAHAAIALAARQGMAGTTIQPRRCPSSGAPKQVPSRLAPADEAKQPHFVPPLQPSGARTTLRSKTATHCARPSAQIAGNSRTQEHTPAMLTPPLPPHYPGYSHPSRAPHPTPAWALQAASRTHTQRYQRVLWPLVHISSCRAEAPAPLKHPREHLGEHSCSPGTLHIRTRGSTFACTHAAAIYQSDCSSLGGQAPTQQHTASPAPPGRTLCSPLGVLLRSHSLPRTARVEARVPEPCTHRHVAPLSNITRSLLQQRASQAWPNHCSGFSSLPVSTHENHSRVLSPEPLSRCIGSATGRRRLKLTGTARTPAGRQAPGGKRGATWPCCAHELPSGLHQTRSTALAPIPSPPWCTCEARRYGRAITGTCQAPGARCGNLQGLGSVTPSPCEPFTPGPPDPPCGFAQGLRPAPTVAGHHGRRHALQEVAWAALVVLAALASCHAARLVNHDLCTTPACMGAGTLGFWWPQTSR